MDLSLSLSLIGHSIGPNNVSRFRFRPIYISVYRYLLPWGWLIYIWPWAFAAGWRSLFLLKSHIDSKLPFTFFTLAQVFQKSGPWFVACRLFTVACLFKFPTSLLRGSSLVACSLRCVAPCSLYWFGFTNIFFLFLFIFFRKKKCFGLLFS